MGVQGWKLASLGRQVAISLLDSYVSGVLRSHFHGMWFLHFGGLFLDETISLLDLVDNLTDVAITFLDLMRGSFVRFLRAGNIFDRCANGLHLCQ